MSVTNIQSRARTENTTESISSCLTCYSGDLFDDCTSGYEVVTFVLNNLLRIPKELLDARVSEDHGQRKLRSSLLKEIRLCGACRVEVERAKGLYEELVKVLQELRGIQRKFVDSVKKRSEGNTTAYLGGRRKRRRETLTDKCRSFVIKHHVDENFTLGKDILPLEWGGCGSFDFSGENVLNVKKEVETFEAHDLEKTISLEIENDLSAHLYEQPGYPKSRVRSSESNDKEIDEEEDDCNSLSKISKDHADDRVEIKMEDEVEEAGYVGANDFDDDNSMRINSENESNYFADIGASVKETNDDKVELGVWCKLCHFYCKSEIGLKSHMTLTHPNAIADPRLIKGRKRKLSEKPIMSKATEGKYKCTVENCGKSYQKLHLLRWHSARHSKTPELKCKFCPRGFFTRKDALDHVKKAHPESIPPEKKQSLPCDICSKVYVSSASLLRHKNRVHKIQTPKERICPEEGCGKVFSCLGLLKTHISRHHGGQPRYKCPKCEKAFHTWRSRWMHDQIDHQDGHSKKPFICEQCGAAFACAEYLSAHRNKIHRSSTSQRTPSTATKMKKNVSVSMEPPVICDLCKKTFKNASTLKIHILQVHQKEKMTNMCHLCPKRFMFPRQLKEHLFHAHAIGSEENRRKTKKGKCFQCSVTGCRLKMYGDEGVLERHMKRIHGEDGNKPGKHKCKYCGKEFFQSIKLKYHEMRHENKDTRPFICDICQKGYPTPDNLKFHRVHTHKLVGEDNRVWMRNKLALNTQDQGH